MTEIIVKKGVGEPPEAQVAEGELALDVQDGILYSKLRDGAIHALNEAPDADNYGHWKLQVDYGTPYQVVSGATANFEGTNGITVTRTGDTITIDGSELDLDEEADNYQYWQYKVDGFNTTNVLSTHLLDFQSGDGIDIAKEGYGIKISATGGGGGGEFVHIGANPPASPEEGQQWMEVPASGEAVMWIYDGGKWLQHPSGKDGAPGADGNIADATTNGVVATWNNTDSQWKSNDGLIINASGSATFANNVTINGPTTTTKNINCTGLTSSGNANAQAFFSGNPQNGLSIRSGGTTGSDPLITRINCPAEGGQTTIRVITADGLNNDYFQFKSLLDQNMPAFFTTKGRMRIGCGNDREDLGMIIDNSGNLQVFGGITKNENEPVTTTRDLIRTLHTLREATKDETTIKGLRDAIGNAVGGLIEKFEAMQASTQEISDE